MNMSDDVVREAEKIGEEGYSARTLTGFTYRLFLCIGLVMALFHIYFLGYSSLEPWILYYTHLGFGLALAYLLYPFSAKSNASRPGAADIGLIVLSVAACAYFIISMNEIVFRIGVSPTPLDLVFSSLVILLVLEMTRRTNGFVLPLIAVLFILYGLYGNILPYSFGGHRGYSFSRLISYLVGMDAMLSTPLATAASFVFLFFLFSSFLASTGAGQFFIDLALGLAGGTRGGPAKVAVISSALCGMVSGSSVGNTVTTGSVTIPMMKRTGYKPEFAGAVEAAASTGGQIMPPIMGAAAFLMAEYMNVTYGQVTLWAILPAVLYFGGIFISVHLEAKKLGLRGIPRSELPRFKYLMRNVYLLLPLVFLIWVVTANIRSLQYAASIAILISIAVSLVGTIRDAAAEAKETKTGSAAGIAVKKTGLMILEALEAGGKGSITVAVACSMAGMIAGCITVTGLASKLISGVVALSSKIPNPTLSLLLALFLTMLCCIVLGMGVPTTANYCIMASTCAPILITLGIPKIAAHFFVFYFGIVADITPPVALAAYAGSAIAKSDPMKTGINATKLAIAAFIVPYMFAMNPSMLLMDQGVLAAVQVIITSCLGIFGIAAALEGYVVTRAPWWQRILLAAGGLCLIDPRLMTDLVGIAAIVIVVVLQIVMRKHGKPAAA